MRDATVTIRIVAAAIACITTSAIDIFWRDCGWSVALGGTALTCALIVYLLDVGLRRHMHKELLAVVCATGLLLVFGIRGVVLGWRPELYWFPDRYPIAGVVHALSLVSIGWLMFLVSYFAPWRFLGARRCGDAVFRRRIGIPGIIAMCAVGCLGRLIQSVFYFSPMGWIGAVGAIPGLAVAVGYVGIGLGLTTPGHRRSFPVIAALVTLGVYFVGSLIMGERVFMLRVASYLVVFLVATRGLRAAIGSPRRFAAVGIAIAGFALAFVLISSYKSQSESVGQEVGLRRYVAAMNVYQELIKGGRSLNEGEGFLASLSRRSGSGLDFFALLVDQTPQIWEFQHGRTIALIGTILVPRVFWPEKPEVTMAGQFYEDYLGYRRINGTLGAAGYSAIGDLFLNWGALGVVLGMIVIGAISRAYEQFCFSSKDVCLTGAILFASTAPDLMQPSSTLSDSFGAVSIRVLAVVLALWVLGRPDRSDVDPNGLGRTGAAI